MSMRKLIALVEAFSGLDDVDPDDWGLYDESGWEKAAEALRKSAVLASDQIEKKAIKLEKDWERGDWKSSSDKGKELGSMIYGVMMEVCDPVMKKHSKYGATDSEPEIAMRNLLVRELIRRRGYMEVKPHQIIAYW